MQSKATVILFLCFTIVVAYFNILISEYQYVLFTIPFAVGCLLKSKQSKVAEIVGLKIIASYIMLFENINMGLAIFIGASVFFFTAYNDNKLSKIYISLTALLVFIVSYIRFDSGADKLVHASLDTMFYVVGSGTLYHVISTAIHKAKQPVKPLEQKYLDTLCDLQKVAHESIDELKRMQGGKP